MAQPETGYVFNGIGFDEARDRDSEHRTGVPPLGGMKELLFVATARGGKENNPFLAGVKAWNTGEAEAHLRLRHGGTEKTITAEILGALLVGTDILRGALQFKKLTAGSLVFTEAGALPTVIDDGNGNLVDQAVPTTVLGTVDYGNGIIDLDYTAAVTLPATLAYKHGDDEDFATLQLSASKATGGGGSGGTSELIQTQLLGVDIGRVNPGSIAISEGGALTFVDDGKGNIIQTNANNNKVGVVDYATGLIDISTATGNLAGTIATLFTINPFAAVLRPGAGKKLFDLFSQIPELTNAAWGTGMILDNKVALHGECTVAANTNLVTQWSHFSEEPFRVEDPFSGFPAGGHDNDPRLLTNTR